jgi:hypothetical protein
LDNSVLEKRSAARFFQTRFEKIVMPSFFRKWAVKLLDSRMDAVLLPKSLKDFLLIKK